MNQFDVDDSSYRPTEAEMEEDVIVDAKPEGVLRALLPADSPAVKSRKGEQSKREFQV